MPSEPCMPAPSNCLIRKSKIAPNWKQPWLSREITMRMVQPVLVGLSLAVIASVTANVPSAMATACLTLQEARSKWTSHHLYWHQGPDGRCWDNHAKGAEHYDPRPQMKIKMTPPPVPSNVAASPPSELEHAAPNAPVAEFYYPVLLHHDNLNDFHV